MSEIWLGGIRLRNRLVTLSNLLGYGVPGSGLVPYGMSPISRFVPLERFGAVTTRTLTVAPRDGHFTNRTDWPLQALPGLLRRYATVLRRADAGWINAFGWCNVGIEAYLRDYYPRTRDQNTIISVGGFAAEEFVTLANAVPRSRHPVILKLSPDRDYVGHARRAAAAGVSALTAINTVRALRLDPRPDSRGWPTATAGCPAGRSSRAGCEWSPSCVTRGSPCR